MPATQVLRQIVCSECGQPIATRPTATSLVERTAPVTDDDAEDDLEGDQGVPVETLVEVGPVCPRCASYR